MVLTIAELPLGGGVFGICPLPGRMGEYAGDIAAVLAWQPDLVISLTTEREEARRGGQGLAADLNAAGIAHRRFSIPDFGTPDRLARAEWPGLSTELHGILAVHRRLLVHCLGGCGRSGMIALRLMVEAGEGEAAALLRLRAVRPCAVETAAQMRWAVGA